MRRFPPAALPVLALALAVVPAAAQSAAQLRQAILTAEDRRAPDDAELGVLLRAVEHRDPAIAAAAARALGRLERTTLAPVLLQHLGDSRASVRVEVAHALGQVAQGADTSSADQAPAVARIGRALLEQAAREQDPRAMGALARSLGRLPWRDAASAESARRTLLAFSRNQAAPDLVLQAARALEQLQRVTPILPPSPEATERLQALAQLREGPPDMAVRIRRIAWAALPRAGGVGPELLAQGLADPDEQVRRLAVLAAGAVGGEGRRSLLAQSLRDPSAMVRYEAVRVWGRHHQAEDCSPVVRALGDRSDRVALLAIDLLAEPCGGAPDLARLLGPYVDSLAGAARPAFFGLASWHRGARAMVTLARVAPERVRGVLNRAAADAVWQVRMYAARAAAALGESTLLITLAHDRDDNVREAAIRGLASARGHGAGSILLDQLARSDYQLLITTAAVLAGTPERDRAAPSLLAALRRVTAERKETSRDTRLALLERLEEVGNPDHAGPLEAWLTDFDPVVARRAAQVIGRWTGRTPVPAARPLPKAPLSYAEIMGYRGKRLRVTMSPTAGGGSFDIELLPELAPATVARVVGLARAGWYDDLTFHRVEPNFVIQGGSPGANEYAGDGPYLRDEIGPLSHERGTLGISTRGRDTGDAQIFVNLVDNPRLDFNYTVWGRVVAGLEVVDAILEGDLIARIELVDGG